MSRILQPRHFCPPLASGNCGSVWAQTFSYDAFGNITKSGSSQFMPGYNAQTNHMSMSSGASYDLNGDVLSDSLNSYAWDTNGRPTTINSVTATYDALGRMVEQDRSGSYTQIQYSPTGFKMQLMNGQTYAKAWVPMPAGTAEVWQASGSAIYYQHADWLGSERFESTTSRTMYNDLAYTPFGEPYAQSGNGDISFAGVNQDTSPNVYDAMYREYGVQGRWPSPDPAGIAAANPANPQSWNRYAYVLNNPNLFTDPLGLVDCPSGTEGIGSSGTCVVVTVPGIYWGEITDIGGPSGGPLAPPINFLGFGGLNELPLGGYHSLEALEPQTPCTLSTAQRVSLGIQGTLNAGELEPYVVGLAIPSTFVLLSMGWMKLTSRRGRPFEPTLWSAFRWGFILLLLSEIPLSNVDNLIAFYHSRPGLFFFGTVTVVFVVFTPAVFDRRRAVRIERGKGSGGQQHIEECVQPSDAFLRCGRGALLFDFADAPCSLHERGTLASTSLSDRAHFSQSNDAENLQQAEKPMRPNKSGFTLLETLVVVAIVVILAAISVPSLLRTQHSARRGVIVTDVQTLTDALSAYDMLCGGYPAQLSTSPSLFRFVSEPRPSDRLDSHRQSTAIPI